MISDQGSNCLPIVAAEDGCFHGKMERDTPGPPPTRPTGIGYRCWGRRVSGIDVAIQVLRATLRSRKATVDEIHQFAEVCRVAKVMQPYLESEV